METSGEYSEETSRDIGDSRGRNAQLDNELQADGLEPSEGYTGAVAAKASVPALVQKSSTIVVRPREKVEVTLQSLLQAGVHFGHQTSRWSPAMSKYIFTARNGIHILHLPKTIQLWKQARQAIVECIAGGGNILFVGTKKQAQEPVMEEAIRCSAFFVSQRWLGGMMSNFQTIRRSIDRMAKIEQILREEEEAIQQGAQARYTKKERLMMSKEYEKLDFSLGGIRQMYSPPSMLFVIDMKREEIAIREARKLDIPVVALVDSNCDPAGVDFPIPSNDDGSRAIRFFCEAVADAVLEGRELNTERLRRAPGEHAAHHAANDSGKPAPEVSAAELSGNEGSEQSK